MLTATVSLAGAVLAAAPATAANKASGGTVSVTINAPAGVPANAQLTEFGTPSGGPAPAPRASYFIGKAPEGTSSSGSLTLGSGSYHVVLPDVTFSGTRYVGEASRPEVVVRAGDTTAVTVTYHADGGASSLHATSIGKTSVRLAWTGPQTGQYQLRRATGQTPVGKPNDGVAVPIDGTTGQDAALTPGTKYSYALFTKQNSRWVGPLVISAGTESDDDAHVSYIAAPTTLLATADDIQSAVPTGNGVRVVLTDRVPTPLLGSAVVLPISDALAGGYLGVVSSVSPDGRTLDLVAGSLDDAFDYYNIDVEDFSTDVAAPSGKSATSRAAVKAATMKSAGLPVECGDVSGTNTITFSPSMSLGGHFKGTIDKFSFLGQDVPDGASLDIAVTAKVTGAASIKTDGEYSCGLKIKPLVKTIATDPIPMTVKLEPKAEFAIGGGLDVSNLGFTATGGVQVAGGMSLAHGASFDGHAMLDAEPLTPEVKVNGSVGLKIGGELTVGPGVGTADAGVIAGVDGELDPLDATWQPYVTSDGTSVTGCSVANAQFSRSLGVVASAWLDNWSWEKKITVSALEGSTPYGGSPWYLPSGCNDSTVPPGTLFGPGVTKVDESTGGSPDQSGYVQGFVPDQNTWVLSNGRIEDALGTPDFFASTDMGGPGDPGLTAMAGQPTYDAAYYQVTVIPAASNLHVRYVFASEEYPEWVGSSFNDVMGVFVDGQNCATVPGTSLPVSINTINDHTNSAYYVDNSTGAAGYSTSMDALTEPLTCSVPVTPGQPVTIRVAVADSSDHYLDSAVALVDGGIWSD